MGTIWWRAGSESSFAYELSGAVIRGSPSISRRGRANWLSNPVFSFALEEEELISAVLSTALFAARSAATMRLLTAVYYGQGASDLLGLPAAGGGLGRPAGDGGLRVSLIGDLPRAGRASVHPDQMARTRLR